MDGPRKPLFAAASFATDVETSTTQVAPAEGKEHLNHETSCQLWLLTGDKAESSGQWLKACSFKRPLELDEGEPVIKKLKKHKRRKRKEEEAERKRHEAEIIKGLEKKSLYQELKKKTFLEETGLSAERAFRIDKAQEKSNLAFDSLYRLLAPLYEIKQCYPVHASKYTEKKKLKKAGVSDRYFDQRIKGHQRYVYPLMVHSLNDFIPFVDHGDDQQKPSVPENSQVPEDQSLRFASLTSPETESKRPCLPTPEQLVHDRQQYFNEYLRKNPNDIEKWMEFIKFQEKLLDSKVENRSTAILEKKLAIIEKAIHSNTKCLELLILRLEVAGQSEQWGPEKVSQEWKRMAFLYPQHIEVWIRYISFVSNHLTHFTTSKVISIFSKCFGTLNKILEGEFQTHRADGHKLELDMIHILNIYCRFLRNVGHTERSVASFQSIIEFNFNTPKFLDWKFPLSDWISYFEPYWDCADPRVGEDHSQGWARLMESKTPFLNRDTDIQDILRATEDEIYEKYSEDGHIWSRLEQNREYYEWLPAHGKSVDEIDDCDRNVLFDDIQLCLFRLRRPESRWQILRSFLCFMGLADDGETILNQKLANAFNKSFIFETCKNHERFEHHQFCSNLFDAFENFVEDTHRPELEFLRFKFAVKNGQLGQIGRMINSMDTETSLITFTQIDLPKDQMSDIYNRLLETLISSKSVDDHRKMARKYCKYLLRLKPLDQVDVLENIYEASCVQEVLVVASTAIIGERCDSISPITNLKVNHRWKDMLETSTVDALFLYGLFSFFKSGMADTRLVFENQLARSDLQLGQKIEILEDYLQILLIQVSQSFSGLHTLRDVVKRGLLISPCHPGLLSVLIALDSKSVGLGDARQYFLKPPPQDSQIILWWLYAISFVYQKLILFRRSCLASGESHDNMPLTFDWLGLDRTNSLKWGRTSSLQKFEKDHNRL